MTTIKCEILGCSTCPVYVCKCSRCEREPSWDYEEHFYSCEEHKVEVEKKHWRIRERHFQAVRFA